METEKQTETVGSPFHFVFSSFQSILNQLFLVELVLVHSYFSFS